MRIASSILLWLALGAILLTAVPAAIAPSSHEQLAPPYRESSASAQPWDPLIGNPALGVPRYQVTTGYLSPSDAPAYSGAAAWLAYDPGDSAFWVAAPPSSVEEVPNSQNWTSSFLPVGSQPFGVAVDNGTNRVYVTNTGSNNVSIVDGPSDRVIGSVGVGDGPMGITFDSADHEMYVANALSNNVSVVSTITQSVIASVAVGRDPIGIGFDPATSRVFVADHGSYDVSVIDTATRSVVATVPAGIGPYGVAIDNASDMVFVSNEGSENVSVIGAASAAVVASIPVLTPLAPDLQGLAYDAKTDQVFVGAGDSYLIVLNASALNLQFVYSTDPSGVAYDPTSGTVCFTNSYNSTFECMTPTHAVTNTESITFTESGLPAGTTWSVAERDGPGIDSSTSYIRFWAIDVAPFSATYSFVVPNAAGYVPTPSTPRVDISGGSTSVGVVFAAGPPQDSLYFNETGLVPGSGWSVDLNGSVEFTSSGTILYRLSGGTYNFTIGPVDNYRAAPASGSVRVNGTIAGVYVVFSSIVWWLDFAQVSLPTGTTWYVNLTSGPAGFVLPPPVSSNTLNLAYQLANGTYNYTAQSADKEFVGPPTGSVEVRGTSPGTVFLTFRPVLHNVTFVENGLPAGTRWQVLLNGTDGNSTASHLNFSVPNGIYSYTVGGVFGYAPTPAQGSVTVRGSDPAPVVIGFVSTSSYAVTFHETGLAPGTGWSVAIGSQFQSSLSDNITLIEVNGTYGYVIQAVPGYTTNYSGVVTVAGANVSINVRFAVQTFPVIVVEFGLPNGTNWSVTVANASTGFSQTRTTNGAALIFYLPNGTYTVYVSVPPGWLANITSATFTVAGTAVGNPSVQFSHPESAGGGTKVENAPVPPIYWWILGGLVALTTLASAAALMFRRRPGSGSPPPAAP